MNLSAVWVTGLGIVSGLGPDLSKHWQRLIAGESGIRLAQPYSELPPLPLALIHDYPADFRALLRQTVAVAVDDAGLALPLPDCGVVVGSSRSQQATLETFAKAWIAEQQAPEAAGWWGALPHMGAIATAHQLQSQGPVRAPMAACATGILALYQGMELIQRGECQQVVVATVETPITPLTLAGFQQMGAMAETGCYPFDKHREGLVLGEGAAVLVLEAAASAQQRGAKPYGQLLGVGLTADAYHMSAPDPQQRGAERALKDCLQRSGLTADDVDLIHAHGTSTRLNDASEANLIQRQFQRDIPVISTKGATGHTLGASGAMGAIFSLLAMQHQQIPPCVGLKTPEFSLKLPMQPLNYRIERALCFSFGFGGQNGVLALGRVEA